MTWLVVGLGNPGPTYAKTRHNTGFLAAAELARRSGVSFTKSRANRAEVAETRLGPNGLGSVGAGEKLIIIRPLTYMNESGQAVGAVARFAHLRPDHIIVIHDELDLQVGQLRVKCGGGDNGHRGLKSIRDHLHTGDFFRIRLGIGRPSHGDPVDYVLSQFTRSENADLSDALDRAVEAVISLVNDGLAPTQNRFNC